MVQRLRQPLEEAEPLALLVELGALVQLGADPLGDRREGRGECRACLLKDGERVAQALDALLVARDAGGDAAELVNVDGAVNLTRERLERVR